MAAFDEAGGCGEVVVGAERDDEDVGVVGVLVGDHAAGGWVDGGDELLAEVDAGLVDGGVGGADVGAGLAAEHELELREAEDEGVVLVDEGDADLVAELLREAGGELEATEAGAEDDDVCGIGHGASGAVADGRIQDCSR